MITRTISGIALDVISPSFYQVAAFPQIEIAFVGDQWQLWCPNAEDQPTCVPVPSLALAAALVAEALRLP